MISAYAIIPLTERNIAAISSHGSMPVQGFLSSDLPAQQGNDAEIGSNSTTSQIFLQVCT
jgi:hypothetical protein